MKKLSIIIPVFNESSTLEKLLNLVWNQKVFDLEKEILIVESNSSDGSREIVKSFYNKYHDQNGNSLKLILQDSPKGKGFAVREGLSNATGDIILIQDADLEYEINDYPSLISPILEGHADFVLGSRHLSAGSWKIRKFESNRFKAILLNLGGIFFHTLFNVLYGVLLTDPTTMFKVFRRKCIEGFVFESNRFDFDFEILGKLIRAGYIPLEVPVTYKSRSFDDGKKVTIFRDPLTWIRAIIKFRLCKIRRMPKNVVDQQLAQTNSQSFSGARKSS